MTDPDQGSSDIAAYCPTRAAQLAALNGIYKLADLRQPVPSYQTISEAKASTPDVLLRTWIPVPTYYILSDAEQVLKQMSTKLQSFWQTNSIPNFGDTALRIVITTALGARMLTLAQAKVFPNADAQVKLSQLEAQILTLSKKADGNADVYVWTMTPSLRKLQDLKTYAQAEQPIDYMYEKFLHHRKGSSCYVLKDKDDWEENEDHKDLFRPDIFLGLFIIKRLVSPSLEGNPAVIWDLTPCPTSAFYDLLGMPHDSVAPGWFGAIYALQGVCNLADGGRTDDLHKGIVGMYMASF